ncbi:beta-galactosidase [Enterococcus sp.]|uniref:beta-galactosidase n=1 Tax=Enterococcus sp. TaxID=35783 RepID=UPI0025C173EF|nr:beta-galactosidase [Enterococcus sp.]
MKIILGGDSTRAECSLDQMPMMSWGEALPKYLDQEVEVLNAAQSRNTRSFMKEGHFDTLLKNVSANDIVLLQFGYKDQHPENQLSYSEFTNNLTTMIKEIKKHGGRPILCSPVVGRIDETEAHLTLTDYQPFLKRISQSQEIPFFDLNRYTYYMYQGPDSDTQKFLWLKPEEKYPDGSQDNPSFSKKGAEMIARYVALRLRPYVGEAALFSKYYYGACMYPEVWSEEVFERDVQRMKALGMNFARIGEFIWQRLEPQEGVYDFSTLERALQLYQKYDIDVCLCIPTPTPPRWFTKKYPEAVIKNQDGTTMSHGSRQHVCTNNEDYRRHAYQLTQKIAAFTRKYPNIVMIQLDNEFKCHVDLCYCATCQQRWHQFLQEEYQTVEQMNESWGTRVWSEWYDDFTEVILPLRTPFLHNSSLMNAFRRFTAETLNEFAHDLCHFIRMECTLPITHNTAFGFNLQNEALFADLDVTGFDTYAPADNYPAYTMNLDRWRNIKSNQRELLLLETCTANAGHIENYAEPRPKSFVTSEAFIGYAGNLKVFSFWHFRGHRYGVEQPHSAVVTAWGEPDRGYEEVVEIGKLRAEIQPLLASSEFVPAKIAVMYSDHAKRFFSIENGGIYDHRELFTDFYGSLIRQGIRVEIIPEDSSFEEYDLILVPFVRWISSTVLEKFQKFTAQGGKLILGPLTGDRTRELAWPATNGLDRLGEWLGLHHIQQYLASANGSPILYEGMSESADRLLTVFDCPEDWTSEAVMNQRTIIAKQKKNSGEIIYLGGLPQSLNKSKLWKKFSEKEILPFESDRQWLTVGEGIVKYQRKSGAHIQIWLVNMEAKEAEYQLKKAGYDRLNGQIVEQGSHILPTYAYRIIEWQNESEKTTTGDCL